MTQSIRYQRVSFLAVALLIVGLIGCGGSGQTTTEKGALGVCNPAEGAVGSKVVCEAEGISDDCTVFFGNTPVESTLNDGFVSFVVPPTLPGEKEVRYQCGDQGVTPLGKFVVPSKKTESGDSDVVPSDDNSNPSDGEEIVPSGNKEAPPAEPEAPQEETPPAPTSASIGTFEVTKVTAAAKMNTVKIKWEFSNAKSAYVWGDFNREASDANKAGDAQCGLVGTRHLVTGPDGKKFNEGSTLYEQNLPFLEGTLCNNVSADTSDDCRSQSSTASLENRRPLFASRFGHSSATGDLYFYDFSKVEKVQIEKSEGLGPDVALLLEESNPNCRIDLTKDDASLITDGHVYTRSLAQFGRFCLAVEGVDGSWTVSCKSVNAEKTALTAMSDGIRVSTAKPVVVLDFDYTSAVAAPEAEGCNETAASTEPDSKGFGHYHAECPIKKETMEIAVSVQGIGEKNKSKLSFRVEFAKPDAVMTLYGSPLGADEQGEFKLQYSADRSYKIRDLKSGEVITPQDARCPWVNGIELYGQYVVDGEKKLHPGFKKVTKASDAQAVVTAYRDTTFYFWSFSALGFDGFPSPSNVVHMDYESGVSKIAGSHTHTCSKELDWKSNDTNLLEALMDCGEDLSCWKKYTEWNYGGNHQVVFNLEVQNVKSLTIDCEGDWKYFGGSGSVKSETNGQISGYTTKTVSVNTSYPIVECKVEYEKLNGEFGKIETSDSCYDYDYGNATPTALDVQALLDETL